MVAVVMAVGSGEAAKAAVMAEAEKVAERVAVVRVAERAVVRVVAVTAAAMEEETLFVNAAGEVTRRTTVGEMLPDPFVL